MLVACPYVAASYQLQIIMFVIVKSTWYNYMHVFPNLMTLYATSYKSVYYYILDAVTLTYTYLLGTHDYAFIYVHSY